MIRKTLLTTSIIALSVGLVAQQRQPLLDGAGHVREDAYIPRPCPHPSGRMRASTAAV